MTMKYRNMICECLEAGGIMTCKMLRQVIHYIFFLKWRNGEVNKQQPWILELSWKCLGESN